MGAHVITVENLGNKCRIAHEQANGMRYKALRDVLADETKSVAAFLLPASCFLLWRPGPVVRSPVVRSPVVP